jgi:hypothetical protein
MPSVGSIVVENNAAFNVRFWIGGNEYSSTNNSGNFLIGQRKTIDLASCTPPIVEGFPIWPQVQAVLVGQPEASGKPFVTYKRGSTETATYTVDGHETNWSVNLNK